jgi:DNA-binding PadR family transcriptional regulator
MPAPKWAWDFDPGLFDALSCVGGMADDLKKFAAHMSGAPAILALLQEGPRTGYQIMSEIEERSGGAWRPSPGAVYPALAQLADEGLIVGEESGGRRTFGLTPAGRDYIEQNPKMARGAWESEAQQEAWELPGLFAEAARLGAGIVQIAHAGTPGQVQEAEQLLEQTRRRLYRILADDTDDDEDDESQGDDDGNG